MNSILSSKPHDASDIHSLSDAKAELSRIRTLIQNYHDSQAYAKRATIADTTMTRPQRNAIREEDYITGYVKRSIPKSDSVRNLIYDAIQPNVLFETCTPQELNEILDIFEPVNYTKGDVVIKQGENGNTFYVVERGELSITVAVAGEHGCNGDVIDMVVVSTRWALDSYHFYIFYKS
jgi:DNA repair exonuclease SbcCD ATPase subunit